uniref:UPF0506 domain-containing protein n=1 Tax=Schistosoma mansoni TaxID=6183 RepID=A0A5K4FA63_SCHMA
MYPLVFISILFTLLSQINISEGLFQCRQLGETCHKTLFDRCCGRNVCQLKGWTGRCVKCLNTGDKCLKSKECCNGRCVLFKCKDKGIGKTTNHRNKY